MIDESYLDYLRKYEHRIPKSNYGTSNLKPFFGKLFEKGDLVYVTQISHAKKRHEKMKNSPDFVKIYLSNKSNADKGRLVAVVNLNYMFPVPKLLIQNLNYANINKHRTFNSQKERSQYIYLLKKELNQINSLNINLTAKNLYNRKIHFQTTRYLCDVLTFVSWKNWQKIMQIILLQNDSLLHLYVLRKRSS